MKHAALLFLIVGVVSHVDAQSRPSVAVPPAYEHIAGEHTIPPVMLFAVSLTESRVGLHSGRRMPWPWTLNIAGTARYFPTRDAAYQALQAAIAQGQTVDVGLCQTNWQWNRARLGDPWQALDPYFNLHTAASLLREHFQACRQDWWCAVGRYHAPNDPARAQRYAQRVRAHLQEIGHDIEHLASR